MKKKLTFCAALFLTACVSAKLAGPAQSDVERVKDKFPGYTLAQLKEGQNLYENNCNLCHGLKDPKAHSEVEWQEIVPRMAMKVNKKDGHHLSESDQTLILRYVVTMHGSPNQE